MNIQDYIKSGIVESYVFGLVNEKERLEFEQLAAKYPELSTACAAFEDALEKHAMANAVVLSDNMRSRFLEAIENNKPASLNQQKPISTENVHTPVRETNWLRIAIAAAAIIILGCAYFIYKSNAQNQAPKTSNKDLQERVIPSDSLLRK